MTIGKTALAFLFLHLLLSLNFVIEQLVFGRSEQKDENIDGA
jgi:hypothetical protein